MVAAISPASVQISSVAVSATASDYCCNDPGCNCKGGREAKKALEARREQADLDQVSVSAAGLAALRAEGLAPAGQLATDDNTQTINAVQPPAALQAVAETRKATETEPLQALPKSTPSILASSPPDRPTASVSAVNAYAAAARDEAGDAENGKRPARLDTYA